MSGTPSGTKGSEAPRVRALALHAAYRCRRSGACCTSGWEIPVEPEAEERLCSALRSGRLRSPSAEDSAPVDVAQCLPHASGLPHGARVLLGHDPRGHCVFHETADGSRCAIQARLGEEALPSACRHFPRVVRLTPRGVDVTLSHYCLTVSGLLFETTAGGERPSDPLLQIVLSPPAFPRSWPYQGLDARQDLPPLLRPGVLMGWEGHERWEAHAVERIATAPTPEAALAALAEDAERIRAWTPRDGDFEPFLERELARSKEARMVALPAGRAPSPVERAGGDLAFWEEVVAAVPAAHRGEVMGLREPDRVATAADPTRDSALVAPAWPRFQAPIRRWLAAKAFASWIALQGDGLRTSVLGLRLALGVLRAEALLGSVAAGRALDEELLRAAVRRADLLLLHLVDPEALARRLARCERPAGPN